ncbi:MAG: putative transport system ATP-binding protein [Methanolobus sp.]|jgi:putative ABC transport system ATP-binding protein|uniref:ABC transporter ATP-binding protein n=1 Tax=Methanolobus sp. TaxID=1874737 RepID=UPI002583A3D9|nr:ABC transporter ATP-binding protein [Methanolobus sp.]MDK2830783.1 putative transport system ATP-binding protein [Methanolobus sp.]MDK2938440.1 putative transport system ATP-binding protein [Methanolobus sp.]
MDGKAAYNENSRINTPVIELVNLCKSYHVGDMDVPILKSIDLRVMPGEFVAIMGPSGSGKSTLMNMIGCLDRPNCGQVLLMGKDVDTLSDPELAKLRGLEIGFVFQNFNLVPRLTTLQNVELPTYANKKPGVDIRQKAMNLVEMVGLKERMNYKPSEMSGGQQQRIAIARALINDPSLILADEPTGNLDSKTGDEIMKIFSDLHEKGRTIVMITHDPDLTEFADRVVHLKDGIIDNN